MQAKTFRGILKIIKKSVSKLINKLTMDLSNHLQLSTLEKIIIIMVRIACTLFNFIKEG